MFHQVFDHSSKRMEVGELLLTLCQGPRRMFTLKFRTIAAGSGWNDAALKAAFRQGFNPEVLTEMACRDEMAVTIER